MQATPIYQDQTFYAPRFEIKLQGRELDRAVIRDVTEVRYTDSLDNLDSFEFKLHDWDPARNEPKFSSPYDAGGQLRTLADGTPVPLFDPGARVELALGYYPQDPLKIMAGQVVSCSPSFPASGTPTYTVRAVNPLYSLQKKQETMTFENKTDSQIAEEIGQKLDIAVRIPPGQQARETPYPFIALQNEYPIVFLLGRARRLGYDLYIEEPEDGDPFLFFGKSTATQVTYELAWGQSLVEFTPTVQIKGQITRVTVRGWRPEAQGARREISETVTWDDLDMDFPDEKLIEAIEASQSDFEEVVVDDVIESEEEARAKAQGMLENKLQELITGQGSTVGLPELRTGRTVVLKGLGQRFSGRYVLTETTHTISGTGYTTQFKARLEGSL